MASRIFRRGFDLKKAVSGTLAADYRSVLIERIKASDFRYDTGRLTVHLAREFGFCYGVDRAVEYAYQTRHRFPDRDIYLTGEIIHNPRVNEKLRSLRIRFLTDPGESVDALGPDDVVILPAFGVTIETLNEMQARGCTLVDTTCGSVANVWKNVKRYAQEGFTAVIHGKVHHEETQATASRAVECASGHYLVVADHTEAAVVCTFIREGGDPGAFLEKVGPAASAGFDPTRDLKRIGLANQTTMLLSESMAIADLFRAAMIERYGEASLDQHFRTFETICSATQDRQDAVAELMEQHRLDLMIVLGGYNSSNTRNLARMCAGRSEPTYHIEDAGCLVSAEEIHHRPVGAAEEVSVGRWLPTVGPVAVGLTAGASTPDASVEAVVRRLDVLCNPPRC